MFKQKYILKNVYRNTSTKENLKKKKKSNSITNLFQAALNDPLRLVCHKRKQRQVCVCVYIYIYIYITVLVVTKSLCGFVLNQVQYNMESTKYLG